MKALLLTLILVGMVLNSVACAQVNAGTVTTEHDKFKGGTTVWIKNMGISAKYQSRTWLFDVQIFTQPGWEKVWLMIRMTNPEWVFIKCHQLDWLVDEKPFNVMEATEWDGSVGSGYVSEFITQKIPAKDFIQLASASTVEGRLCFAEFSLIPKQINTLKEFLKAANLK